MKKIVLTAAAILVGISTAFAGNDDYGSTNADLRVASVDTMIVTSISNPNVRVQKPFPLGSDHALFGH
jgi:hypothetical protein